MANDIDKTSPHYKGEFGSIYEVNQKFTNGGVNGDYVEIDGWAHYWNADRGTWCVNAQRDSYWDELITGIIEKFKLFKGAMYMGVAGLDTVPAKAIGAKMYYFATVAGTYKNFGGLVVPQGINVLYSENGSSWVCSTLLEVAQELGVSTRNVVSQKVVKDALDLKANQSSVNEALAKKANKADMDVELGKKADKATMDVELGKKADKATMDVELGKKADKATMDVELGKKADKATVNASLDLKANKSDVAKTNAAQDAEISKKANQQDVERSLHILRQEIGERTVVEGNVSNNPDEEDLTSKMGTNNREVLSLKDREYNPLEFSGKGYKILRKNIQEVTCAITKIQVTKAPTTDGYVSLIINGVETHVDLVASTDNTIALVAKKIANKLSETMDEYVTSIDGALVTCTRRFGGDVTASSFSGVSTGSEATVSESSKTELRNLITAVMLNQSNCIYEIRYDFDLDGKTLEVPENCTLKFEGGSLCNGTILGNNTSIKGCVNCLSEINAIRGNLLGNINLSWIGVYANNQDNSKNINNLKNINSNIFIVDTNIMLYEPDLILPKNVNLIGCGHSITYNCKNSNNALLILSERCYLENLNIVSTSSNYNGVIVLADTEINKVHTFKLNNVEISGSWNASKDYKSTALKFNASNFKDNSENYITGCQLHGVRIAWVNIGIEFTCVNNNYPSSKSFAWLNEVYIDSLYISALSYGINTSFVDNGVNNKTDSVGPLHCSHFEFQALRKEAVMFNHAGSWTLNINTGFCWDADYKGIQNGGIINVSSVSGSYKTDGTYTDNTGISYNLIDSVKVYKGVYNILSGTRKTQDNYRSDNYNPVTDIDYWTVGCIKSDFLIRSVRNKFFRYFSLSGSDYFSDHIKTIGANLSKSLYYAKGGGCIELTYAKRYAQDNDFAILNINHHIVGRRVETITTGSNNEIAKINIQYSIKKGVIYKGKIKVLFEDLTYKEYSKDINFLRINEISPLQNISNMQNVSSYYVKEGDDLFIEFEAESISEANYINLVFNFLYKKTISANSSWITSSNNLSNMKIPRNAFVYGLEIVDISYYKDRGTTEERPSSIKIGFQYFDTTITKPIWWTGTKWIDATGADV